MTSDDTKVDTSGWVADGDFGIKFGASFGAAFTSKKARDACLLAIQSLPKVTAERDAANQQFADAMGKQADLLAEQHELRTERDALKHALANMLEDGDKTDREAAMKLLGWDKAAPELQARALIGKEPSK